MIPRLAPTERARLARAWREGLPAPWRALLAPAALVYGGGLFLRRIAYAWGVLPVRKLARPVVSVGNLTVGGTGKTPLVELIARTLTEDGWRVVVLSRGYGRRDDGVAAVSDGTRILLGAREAGDEPVLLARRLPGVPVVVGRDRARAGAWALARFAPDVFVLDDGFQHLRLQKDVEVVCLDTRAPWGPGGLLPRGGLREPPGALRRADLIVLTHAPEAADVEATVAGVRRWAAAAPLVLAAYEVDGVEEVGSGRAMAVDRLREHAVLAFAGIAAPESFGATLAAAGIVPRGLVAFPDHHPFAPSDLRDLAVRARETGAEILLTTEKDAVRLPPGGPLPVWALRVRLHLLGDATPWWEALRARLRAAAGAGR